MIIALTNVSLVLQEEVPERPDQGAKQVRGVLGCAHADERGHLLLQLRKHTGTANVVDARLFVQLRNRGSAGALSPGGVYDAPRNSRVYLFQ